MTDEPLFGFSDRGEEVFVPPQELWPDRIRFDRISNGLLAQYQRRMSSADWRPGPGRKISWAVYHDTTVVGILQLASGVFTLGARDTHLDLPKDTTAKGHALRSYPDMSVCIGAQPLAWYWNLGKLIAMVAPTMGDHWEHEYGDPLLGVVTTAVYGRSSQYNRVMKHIGYTKGYGSAHISDDTYAKIREWVLANHKDSIDGNVLNSRMRLVQFYNRHADEKVQLHHGRARGVYYSTAIPPEKRRDQILAWYERWGHPRWCRTRNDAPPYDTAIQPTKEYREAK